MQLADSLAFISASTNNKFRVIIVNTKENRDKKGMAIRLAFNIKNLLQLIKTFNNIAEILKMAVLKGIIKFI